MNAFIIELFRKIEAAGISYCHFKSNNNLQPALCGVDDLDLLVAQGDTDRFMQLISGNGFRIAMDRDLTPTPFVYHFYGMDPETGLIVHLHVYFRLITGGSILKNHWIRVEDMFLHEARPDGVADVFIPPAEADLILFVIRKFIEQPSLIEHFLYLRDWTNIKAELNWLMERADRKTMRQLVAKWLPELPVALFDECLDLMLTEGTIAARVKLGLKMRQCFTQTVIGGLRASLDRSRMFFVAHLRGKLSLTRKDRFLFPGGMLIAFVGSEASGKSTLSREIAAWLGARFDVSHIHMGKPRHNWRTRPFWLAIKTYLALKRILKPARPTPEGVQGGSGNEAIAANLPHPLICWLDSIDRRQWLKRHLHRMLQGSIVITDRYPAVKLGGLDGARIEPSSALTRLLARLEQKNYSGMPRPDIVMKAMAPLEVTLERNSQRAEPEPESFVRQRYEQARAIDFAYSRTFEMDTTCTLEETVLTAKRIIWRWGGKPAQS